ncbi:vitamin K epoxide reductase family protein [Candidatus Woesearchaeota archaeon]|nr:MAG: vitamin K epoxide reductase family protein [Candidatus Woesearchaeota archaeon]
MKYKPRIILFLLALPLLGFLLSFSIYVSSFSPSGTTELCLSGGDTCSSVMNSSFGEFMGIPMSLWGSFYFLWVLTLLFLIFKDWLPEDKAEHILMLTLGAGLTTSAILISAMIFVLKKLCGSCLAVHTVNIVLVASVLYFRNSWSSPN